MQLFWGRVYVAVEPIWTSFTASNSSVVDVNVANTTLNTSKFGYIYDSGRVVTCWSSNIRANK